MNHGLRRIVSDMLKLRNMEAYAAAAVAASLAVLSIVGDLVSVNLRWAALLAAVAVLVYRTTVPVGWYANFEQIAGDRTSFDEHPLSKRWGKAREVWIFAPSGVNLLNAQTCDLLRKKVLARPDAVVRVVILDASNSVAVQLTKRQLDDSLDYPMQDFAENLRTATKQLDLMSKWKVAGSFEYRLINYNPGFSLVVTNASGRDASLIVEFHAFHNETTHSRMHLELTPKTSDRWFTYWVSQFDHIWEASSQPGVTVVHP